MWLPYTPHITHTQAICILFRNFVYSKCLLVVRFIKIDGIYFNKVFVNVNVFFLLNDISPPGVSKPTCLMSVT